MQVKSIEICCGSVEDALAAYQGGAKRIELNSALSLGGLTPGLGTLRLIKEMAPDLQVMCMVRPRESGFRYSKLEFDGMLYDAESLLSNGADGIVFGCLNPDRTLDEEKCCRMLEVIGEKTSVFHRAIDLMPNLYETLDQLIELGVTRVLTSGQKPTALQGAEEIRRMIEYTEGRMEILPGSGIRPENVKECMELFHVPYLHASCHSIMTDETLHDTTDIHFHGTTVPPEYHYKQIEAGNVAKLLSMISAAGYSK